MGGEIMNDIAFKVIIKNDGIDDIIFKTIMLKGEKGDKGDAGGVEIDDSTTSATKTWSSQKINSMIAQMETIEDVAIASFSDGADDVPVSELIVDITAVESGSGEKSPENQYTISGWSSAKISQSTKNILDLSLISGYGANRYFYRERGLRLVSGQVYTFSVSSACNGIYIRRMSDNTNIASNTNQSSLTFTATDELLYIVLWRDAGFTNFTYQLEKGNTATAYEEPNVYTFTFGQTVYGGHFDNKGNLVITHGIYNFTGSEVWNAQSGYAKYYSLDYILRDLAKLPPNNYQSVPIKTAIGDYNVPYANLHAYTHSMCIAEDGRIGITSDLYSGEGTLAGVWLYYELANPITLSITSQDIPTLLGNNNIFSNTGKINKLVYFKTGSEAVARMIEAYMRASN
jgi:hypothetical protein